MVTEYTVLVVDDERAYCEIMRELLELISLNVVVANNVSDALSLLEGLIPDIMIGPKYCPASNEKTSSISQHWIRSIDQRDRLIPKSHAEKYPRCL